MDHCLVGSRYSIKRYIGINENVFRLQPTHLRKSCHVGECHMQFTDIFPGIVCSRRSDRSVVNLSIFLDMRSQQETHVSHAMLAMLCRGSLWLYFCTTRYFVEFFLNQNLSHDFNLEYVFFSAARFQLAEPRSWQSFVTSHKSR